MINPIPKKKKLYTLKPLFFSLLLLSTFLVAAQEQPPIPIEVEVSTAQFLNFGAYTAGNAGGTISVDYNGTRTWTGDIVLLNFGQSVSPALYDVKANPGTIVSITHAPSFVLSGSNGGTMVLQIDSYSTGKTFVTNANPPSTTPVYIGGTLLVKNQAANPPGKYNGTITITFNQQ